MYSTCAVAVAIGITQYAAASLSAKGMTRSPPVVRRAAVHRPQQMGLPEPSKEINANDMGFNDEVTPQTPVSQGHFQAQWGYGAPTSNYGYSYPLQSHTWVDPQAPIDQEQSQHGNNTGSN